MLGRIEIEPHDGLQFLGELRVIANLECAHQVRLQAMFMPDPPHALFADATGLRHGAGAPVGGVVGFRLGGFANHVLDLAGRNRGRPPRSAGIFLQAGEALQKEPLTPSGRLLIADVYGCRDLQVLHSFGGQKDDSRTLHLADGQRPRPCPLLQGLSLFVSEHHRWGDTHVRASSLS